MLATVVKGIGLRKDRPPCRRVAHVVANVLRDRSGVARIVLGIAFAQLCRRGSPRRLAPLVKNTTPKSRKDRKQRRTEASAHHGIEPRYENLPQKHKYARQATRGSRPQPRGAPRPATRIACNSQLEGGSRPAASGPDAALRGFSQLAPPETVMPMNQAGPKHGHECKADGQSTHSRTPPSTNNGNTRLCRGSYLALEIGCAPSRHGGPISPASEPCGIAPAITDLGTRSPYATQAARTR